VSDEKNLSKIRKSHLAALGKGESHEGTLARVRLALALAARIEKL
jgi:hypothetical protein